MVSCPNRWRDRTDKNCKFGRRKLPVLVKSCTLAHPIVQKKQLFFAFSLSSKEREMGGNSDELILKGLRT